ncbi:MAG: Fe-S cluster assembly sulfur transfer protein SufU [Spirochaetales bacterium]
MSLNLLYQEVILEHYKHPRNKVPLEGSIALHENPSCGDSIRLKIEKNSSGKIFKVLFDGQGCAISTASASIMTELLVGKNITEARALCFKAIAFLKGETKVSLEYDGSGFQEDTDPPQDLGELEALSGVHQFPLRVKCATLPWNAALAILQR